MPDVFISYSRKDSDFVRKLHDALDRIGHEAWVDWEDIPLTADWWREIREAIEAADAFVFVISPDSVASDVCRDEIQHAIDNNKRFIPLLYRELDPEERDRSHPAVQSHNWIFFDDPAQFDQTFHNLIQAIDTDLDYVRKHTRLLVRAKEWEGKGREASYLISGLEMREYQDWLRQSEQRSPKPTELQLAYILASQAARNQRQRFYLAGVILVLILVIGFIALAFFQNEAIAESNARLTEERLDRLTQEFALTEQQGNLIAQHATATAREGTAAAQLTVLAVERTVRAQDALAAFATLTQQAQLQRTATAARVTLDYVAEVQVACCQISTEAYFQTATQTAYVSPTPTPSLTPSRTPDLNATANALVVNLLAQTREAEVRTVEARTQVAQLTARAPTTTPVPTRTATATTTPTATQTATATVPPTATYVPTATLRPTQTATPIAPIVGEWFVSPDGDDTNACYNPIIACRTIESALAKAAPGDTVNVALGIYPESLNIQQDVIIQGTDADLTIIDGGGSAGVVTISADVAVTLAGLTITGGNSDDDGGGILNFGTLTLDQVIVSDNFAANQGGGIANYGALVIVDSRIEGNFATLGNDIYNADQAEIETSELAGVFIDTCPVIVREALDRIDCADGAEVCLSSGEAISRAAFRPDELAPLDRSTGEWGVALVQSGPLVVFGDPGADAYPSLIGRTALTNSLNDTLNIRANPGLNEPILVELEHGSEVTLIGEPQQTDDLDWWRVDYGEGEGWVVDKVGDFRTLLLNTPDTLTVGRTVAIFADLLNLRASPGTDDAVVRVSQRGVDMVILDGPVENDGFTWWYVRNTFGYEGWAAEFADGEPTFLPVVNAAPVGDFHIFSFPDGLDAPNCWPLNELPGP